MIQVLTLALLSIFTGLSQSAGIGGGPIINVFLLFNYDSKTSISLTFIFLIGGSLASIWRNYRKKNPKTGHSFVNYDLVLLTLPISSAGAVIGSIFKNFLSQMVTTVLFTLLFMFLIYDIIKKLIQVNVLPNTNKIKQQGSMIESKDINKIVNSQKISNNRQISQQYQKQYQIYLIQQSKKHNRKFIYVVILAVIYYILIVVLSLVRGGLNYESIMNVNPCGLGGWCIVGGIFVASVVVSKIITNKIRDEIRVEKEVYGVTGMEISETNQNKFVMIGLMAGVVGSTLGIGGGILFMPIWLNVGIDKESAVSTTPILILTSAMISFAISLFNGFYSQIPIWKLFIFFGLAFISSIIIKEILMYIAQRYQIKFCVIIMLLILVVISLMAFLPFQFVKMKKNFGKFNQFGVLC